MIKLKEKKQYYSRLEDFIWMAREGRRVDMEVELKKLPVIHEIHAEAGHDIRENIQTYLLIAYFTFKAGGELHKLSKVYMFATQKESLDSFRVNKEIANVRLRMDFDRMRAAQIHFREEYF